MKYIIIKNEDHYHSVFMGLIKEGYKIDLNIIDPNKSPKDIELIAILDNILKILYKITPLDCGSISNESVLKAMNFEKIE